MWLNDINGALKRHLHPIHKLGHSNTDSLYYKMWQKTLSDVDRRTSNSYLDSANLAPMAIRLTFQARTWPHLVWPNKHSQPKVQVWAGAIQVTHACCVVKQMVSFTH